MATRPFLIAALLSLLTGCTPYGAIFTETVVPCSTRFDAAPVGSRLIKLNTYQIKEPFTSLQMYVEWSTGRIAEEARKQGLQRVYYADLRTLSILFGTYKRETLLVYGE